MSAHILFAAENAVMLAMLSVALKQHGFYISRAECSDAALNILSKQKADLVVVNLSTPDNLDLCKRVRSNITTSRLPIIAIGSNDAESRANTLAAGANQYITNPVFLEQLLKSISELM